MVDFPDLSPKKLHVFSVFCESKTAWSGQVTVGVPDVDQRTSTTLGPVDQAGGAKRRQGDLLNGWFFVVL
jgi:hypothetical protein